MGTPINVCGKTSQETNRRLDNNMNKLVIAALAVTLLALSVESSRLPRQVPAEEKGTLAGITDYVSSYYDESINTLSSYIDSIRGLKLEEKVKNIYDETSKVVGTYAGIAQDQFYYLLYPQ